MIFPTLPSSWQSPPIPWEAHTVADGEAVESGRGRNRLRAVVLLVRDGLGLGGAAAPGGPATLILQGGAHSGAVVAAVERFEGLDEILIEGGPAVDGSRCPRRHHLAGQRRGDEPLSSAVVFPSVRS